MNKIISFLTASMFFSASASIEVEGLPNKVKLESSGDVGVRLFLPENQAISCAGENFHFSFPYEGIGQAWVNLLQEARTVWQPVTIDYNESDCQILAISNSLVVPDGGTTRSKPLEETGLGNVALLGSNDLSESSYSASGQYLTDSSAAAFDGFTYREKINADADFKLSRGLWMTKKHDAEGKLTPAWIQVDFGKAVKLSALHSIVNAQSVDLGRSPKDAVLYVSNDGTNFSVLGSFTMLRAESSYWPFPRTATAQYFRLAITNNYGDKTFIEIDELEFFQ